MRLINTTTLILTEFFDSNLPKYAILSHTWDADEVTFDEFTSPNEVTRGKKGFAKIQKFCALAKERGHEYGWVDTCSIDKRSSAELSEAINSMYKYYWDAEECFIYLADVPVDAFDKQRPLDPDGLFRRSRWFTRGWTLQELLAPKRRRFFAQNWTWVWLDSPHEADPDWSHADHYRVLSLATGIPLDPLRDRGAIQVNSVATILSWAANRQTTRAEDLAYSLMGLLDVNMPVLYGEGLQKAFQRLQNEFMKTTNDLSIFAWRGNYTTSGLLAEKPADFSGSLRNTPWPSPINAFMLTNIGLSIRLHIFSYEGESVSKGQLRGQLSWPPFQSKFIRTENGGSL